MDKDHQQMNIRLTPDLYEDLKRIAQHEERSLAQTVRYALRRYAAENQTRMA